MSNVSSSCFRLTLIITVLALLVLALPTAALANTLNLFVTVSGGVVGKYTTSGATVNSALITGLSAPKGIAVSGSDLFVVNRNGTGGGTIGEYTTSGATVNSASALINISGGEPQFIAASPVPEPSTFVMLGAGLLPVIGVIRRRYLNH